MGAALLCFATAALTGCSLTGFNTVPSNGQSSLPTLAGHVHGGQQPVSGSTIQLYAANTSAAKGVSAALISAVIRTDANGNFTITSDYSCPDAGSLVYIVSAGGNPGLPGSVNNTDIALMAALGPCGSLTSSTFVSINELTTVAAVQALAPFMLDYGHVGSNASNVAGLQTAFSSATAFVDTSTGQFRPSFASGLTPPIAAMNTLADILAACINSSGGSSGDGTSCGKLLQYTSATGDTVAAMLNIVRSPSVNAAQLFSLVSATSPFAPALSAAPSGFAFPAALTLDSSYIHAADEVLSDSQGRIWLL